MLIAFGARDSARFADQTPSLRGERGEPKLGSAQRHSQEFTRRSLRSGLGIESDLSSGVIPANAGIQ